MKTISKVVEEGLLEVVKRGVFNLLFGLEEPEFTRIYNSEKTIEETFKVVNKFKRVLTKEIIELIMKQNEKIIEKALEGRRKWELEMIEDIRKVTENGTEN